MSTIFSWIDQWLTPMWILFFIIVVGYAIGKIKIAGISLDLSAILILSLLVGILFELFPHVSLGDRVLFDSAEWSKTMQALSPLGSALFLSSVGLSSGYEFAERWYKKTLCTFAVGSLSVVVNFVFVKVLCLLLRGRAEASFLYGVFCGAMTSTPGLTVLCEKFPHLSAQISLGYGATYLFGVVAVVLFVQFKGKSLGGSSLRQPQAPTHKRGNPALFGLIQISFVILSGIMLGSWVVPTTEISLGTTGGILISGIITGLWVGKHRRRRTLPKSYSSLYRNFGLVLFFVGNGVPSGMQIRSSFSPWGLACGLLLTILPLFFSYCLCKYLLKQNKAISLSIVCGVMTSTPAFGVLSQEGKGSVQSSAYASAYSGALITIVLLLSLFVSF